MSTGTGLPTPKVFQGGTFVTPNMDLVITPPAGQRVVLYDCGIDGDHVGDPSGIQVLVGGEVRLNKTEASAAGEPMTLSAKADAGIRNLVAFENGAAITIRAVACTAGTLWASVGLTP